MARKLPSNSPMHGLSARKEVRRKVLICDEERNIARLMQINLERMGHEVVVATDGQRAMDAVQEHSPDALIMDVIEPGVDGYEMLRKLRSNPKNMGLQVFLLTTEATGAHPISIDEFGPVKILHKPFDSAQLSGLLD